MLLILPTFCTANSSIIVSAIEERRCGSNKGITTNGRSPPNNPPKQQNLFAPP